MKLLITAVCIIALSTAGAVNAKNKVCFQNNTNYIIGVKADESCSGTCRLKLIRGAQPCIQIKDGTTSGIVELYVQRDAQNQAQIFGSDCNQSWCKLHIFKITGSDNTGIYLKSGRPQNDAINAKFSVSSTIESDQMTFISTATVTIQQNN